MWERIATVVNQACGVYPELFRLGEIIDGLQPNNKFTKNLIPHLRKVAGCQMPLLLAQRDFWLGRKVQNREDRFLIEKISASIVPSRDPIRASGIIRCVTSGV